MLASNLLARVTVGLFCELPGAVILLFTDVGTSRKGSPDLISSQGQEISKTVLCGKRRIINSFNQILK